jgi:hypothetical protein
LTHLVNLKNLCLNDIVNVLNMAASISGGKLILECYFQGLGGKMIHEKKPAAKIL